ncbi:hypothetical protein HELRODRAFT_182442 [Helobdella robusta]|uniref:Uncharacterized protein n=1 Tax=Helobdella robusta TaxID=6412 RepID=T1FI74_HELRO|nr:hypothetical protein HELRODRAFT_182442 [Helobdella robusta]ESN90970.1 hypothetical protein HELRODRAFT_182442 [Helobdella robusta]
MQAPLSFLMRIYSFSIFLHRHGAVFQQQSRRGLAPVLEDNVGTGPHSTFCLCRMDDVSGQIHSIDACQMMVGAMEVKNGNLKFWHPLNASQKIRPEQELVRFIWSRNHDVKGRRVKGQRRFLAYVWVGLAVKQNKLPSAVLFFLFFVQISPVWCILRKDFTIIKEGIRRG